MNESWSQDIRDKWFYGLFAVSAGIVLLLLWPFFEVMVYAAVVAVVADPVHSRLTRALKGRRLVAALLTAGGFAVVVVLPIGVVVYGFAREGIAFASYGMEWVAEGKLDAWLESMQGDLARFVTTWTRGRVPEGSVRAPMLADTVQQGVTTALSITGGLLPNLVSGVASGIIGLVIFVFTVVTLLSEGPRINAFIGSLTPVDPRYETQLVAVFREFAVNMVVGVFVIAIVQGAVAALGYVIFGLPRALFFGTLTGIGAFIPLVGTAVVAVPACIWVGSTYGLGWGLGLAAWSVLVVGTVDNFLRPMLIRGNSNIHPLIIFLGVFGGIWWLGIPGALIGPVLMAMFLALARIHQEDLMPRRLAAAQRAAATERRPPA